MSNTAYILYLQSVQADNTNKIAAANANILGLQQAIVANNQQIADCNAQIEGIQGAIGQLDANNALIAALIAQLSQPLKKF